MAVLVIKRKEGTGRSTYNELLETSKHVRDIYYQTGVVVVPEFYSYEFKECDDVKILFND